MRFSGLLVIVAGAAFAGFHLMPEPIDVAEQLAEVTRISAAPDRTAGETIGPPRTFSASRPLISPGEATSPVRTKPAVQNSNGWTTVVIADPSSAASTRLTSSKPGDSVARAELTRDLQRELTRVGCYGGEIHGGWTAPTRRAMAAFMERVNATLPIDDPDYILLTLVQGQRSAICGAECPSGQSLSGDGRCLPHAVIAQAARHQNRAEQRQREVAALNSERDRQAAPRLVDEPRQTSKAEAARRAADRMALVDARIAAAKSGEMRRVAELDRQLKARTADQNTATAAIASQTDENLPWLQDNGAHTAQLADRRAEPLPGRMAVGVGLPSDATATASIASGAGGRAVALPLPSAQPGAWRAVISPGAAAAPIPRPAIAGVQTNAAPLAHDGGLAVIVPPAPMPAVRPERILDRVATIEDFDRDDATIAPPPTLGTTLPIAKTVTRPSASAGAKSKRPKYGQDAYDAAPRVRRHKGLPRPGSMPYLMMQSMGGGGFF